MFSYIARRLIIALLQLFLVVTMVFALLFLLPGDPVLIILGSEGRIDPVTLEAVRTRLGLDRPILVQYSDWLTNFLSLNLGTSLIDSSPIWDQISARLPRTLELVFVAVGLAIILGIPLGVIAAIKRNSLWDWLASAFTALGTSVPVYIFGTLFILFFAINLDWLPTSGYREWSEGPFEHLKRLLLPAVALALAPTAIVTRMTRSSMLEVLRADYVRTARAKGNSALKTVLKHALRTALIPVITVVGLQLGTLIGSSVLVEYIFNWPGISTLLIEAINRRDYPVVQGVIVVSATLFILINLFVDLLYGVFDPRIGYE